MHLVVLTIFPEVIRAHLDASLLGRARRAGVVTVDTVDIRDHAVGRHRQVDDTVFGGGPGMVFKPEVVAAAVDAVAAGPGWRRLFMSPAGRPLDQLFLRELAAENELCILAGRYEGVDERVLDARGFEPVSIGDYVVAGGELPALIVIEGVCRLLPGVMGNVESALDESHETGLLEAPCYTRPAEWEGRSVPEALLSGDHAAIAGWRRRAAIRRTATLRPDLLRRAVQAGTVAAAEVEAALAGGTLPVRSSQESP